MFGKFTQRYKIGQVVKAKNSNLKILGVSIATRMNKKDSRRYIRYEVLCLTCGYVFRKDQNGFIDTGCRCCSGTELVPGINDIVTTCPEMVPYFQGGYEEATKYTKMSQKKIFPVCPNCGRIRDKKIKVSSIYENLAREEHGFSCICQDGKSYPEKFVYNMLEQLNLNFEVQKPSKVLFNQDNRFYDFYIDNVNCIIETHGEQHYKESKAFTKKSLSEQQKIDQFKELLAKNNGVSYYVVLDCRYSEKQWIKDSIMNSVLPQLLCFQEADINWDECSKFALKSIIKDVCEDYRNGCSMRFIEDKYNISHYSVRHYLKIGADIGWCKYNGCEYTYKPIHMYKDGVLIGSFKGASEIQKTSFDIVGKRLYPTLIKNSIISHIPYKGFTFEYVTDPDEREAILYGDS